MMMNDKIKQFSERAIIDGDSLHQLPHPRYLEKFAKLIIQECKDLIFVCSDDNSTVDDMIFIINSHFGEDDDIGGGNE
jgi:hypothetical protein